MKPGHKKFTISSSNGKEVQEEKYEACMVPIKMIIDMIKKGTWKGSLEEEEVVYNIKHNLYSKEYTKQVKEILKI